MQTLSVSHGQPETLGNAVVSNASVCYFFKFVWHIAKYSDSKKHHNIRDKSVIYAANVSVRYAGFPPTSSLVFCAICNWPFPTLTKNVCTMFTLMASCHCDATTDRQPANQIAKRTRVFCWHSVPPFVWYVYANFEYKIHNDRYTIIQKPHVLCLNYFRFYSWQTTTGLSYLRTPSFFLRTLFTRHFHFIYS